MKVLVLNCGSSSLKFGIIDTSSNTEIIKGICERLGSSETIIHWRHDQNNFSEQLPNASCKKAIKVIVDLLNQFSITLLAVGHRVVHGGEYFANSAIINDLVIKKITKCISLSPLHNPSNLEGIHQCKKLLPNIPQVAVFDTAFHQTMPPRAHIYPIEWDLYIKQGVRRYGFHGTSHRFIAQKAAELINKPIEDLALITAHLGSGCSATAILGGISLDTTMGLTPLEGLMMGSRSGDVDPALCGFLSNKLGWDIERITKELNYNSGLIGVSGISDDMRIVLQEAQDGHKRSELAVEIFCYRLAKAIASLSVPLNGLDCLVFSGGIGENTPIIRKNVLQLLKLFNFKVNDKRNTIHGKNSNGIITSDNSTLAMVIPTNEELMIAKDTASILANYSTAQTSSANTAARRVKN